jgi:hypothetical protein
LQLYLTSLPDEDYHPAPSFELGQPRSASPNSEVFMAALLYKDFLIIGTSQFDKDKELRVPIADISWHSATGRESHTIQDSVHYFGTKQEAEAFAIEAAKAWVDARVKAA